VDTIQAAVPLSDDPSSEQGYVRFRIAFSTEGEEEALGILATLTAGN
jgi:hypothetical protein